MSSRSERVVAHIVIGEGATPVTDALLSASGADVLRLHLRGEPADGRLLLAAIAASDQIICSPWPDGSAADAATGPAGHTAAPAGHAHSHSGQGRTSR